MNNIRDIDSKKLILCPIYNVADMTNKVTLESFPESVFNLHSCTTLEPQASLMQHF